MRAYTAANQEHLIYYTSDGLKLGEHLYEPIGGNRYETVVEPEVPCSRGRVGRRIGRLQVKRETVIWTWTHYLGCGRRVAHKERRVLHQFRRLMTELCRPAIYQYRRKSSELLVTDHCDGTISIQPPESKDKLLVSSTSKTRFNSRSRTPEARWSVRFKFKPGQSKLRPRGSVKTATGSARLGGTWVLVGTTPIASE
ncbi:MAG: hypothetical protein ACI9OJ_000340 [Myxococcota bacterium]|jgi:hypothetical protein